MPDSMDLDKDCKLNDVKLEEIYKRLQVITKLVIHFNVYILPVIYFFFYT